MRGLVVNVVADNGEIIDKCPVSISAMVPSSIPANTENTIKVLCENMQLSDKYQGEVQYIAKFEEAF